MKKNKSHDQHSDAEEIVQEKGQPTSAEQSAAEQSANQAEADQQTPAEPDPLEAALQKLADQEKEYATLSDKYLRLAAEYDNFRRRSQKEKEALYADSIVTVVKEMLPVFDNLERAEQAAGQVDHEQARKIGEGIVMVRKQAEQALERLGVSRIDCVGQPFDPELHEAVMHVEDDSMGPSTVVDVLQTGYIREDRVIRHSMVKVAN